MVYRLITVAIVATVFLLTRKGIIDIGQWESILTVVLAILAIITVIFPSVKPSKDLGILTGSSASIGHTWGDLPRGIKLRVGLIILAIIGVITAFFFLGPSPLEHLILRKSAIGNGIILDPRGGATYSVTDIGGQSWLAQNMQVEVSEDSICYEDKAVHCDECGRLYDGNTAKMVCPQGWHLPTAEEWNYLIQYVGGEYGTAAKLGVHGNYGFDSISCGYRHQNGSYLEFGNSAYYWSSTDSKDKHSLFVQVNAQTNIVKSTVGDKGRMLSVRCIKDDDP